MRIPLILIGWKLLKFLLSWQVSWMNVEKRRDKVYWEIIINNTSKCGSLHRRLAS